MTDIGFLAASAYAAGKDPIDVATEQVRLSIEVAETVRAARKADAGHFPGHGPSDLDTYARRIIGNLLDAGWTPPTAAVVAVAVARRQRVDAWLDRHRADLCRCGHNVTFHLAAPGEHCNDCPDCWSWQPDVADDPRPS